MIRHWIGYGALISLLAFTGMGWYSNFCARMEVTSYLEQCVIILQEDGREELVNSINLDSKLSQCNDRVAIMVLMHNQVDKWCEVNDADVIQQVAEDYRRQMDLALNNESLP